MYVCCDSALEFSPGVNLQHFRPFKRRALINLLKSLGDLIRIFRSQGFGLFIVAGHVDNGQRVFENRVVCCAAEKEGPPGGPSWVWERRISAEEFASAWGGISATALG